MILWIQANAGPLEDLLLLGLVCFTLALGVVAFETRDRRASW